MGSNPTLSAINTHILLLIKQIYKIQLTSTASIGTTSWTSAIVQTTLDFNSTGSVYNSSGVLYDAPQALSVAPISVNICRFHLPQ